MNNYFNPAKSHWQSRAQYIRNATDWYVGSKSECGEPIKRANKHWLPWTGVPRLEDRGSIDRLWLRPTPKQIEKQELPPYLSELTQTRFLAMPITLLPTLTRDQLPPGLVTLWLDLAGRYTNDGRALPRWPEELVLPRIRGLLLHEPGNTHFEFGQDAEWHELGLRGRNLPDLEFLSVTIDAEQRALEDLVEFGELRYLALANVQAVERAFAVAPTTLEHLSIQGRMNLDFSGVGVARLSRLRSLYLQINGDYDPELHGESEGAVDCRHFSELLELEDLYLTGVDRLTHAEALLECPRIEWLHLHIFGGPLPDQLKAKFEARGFRSLVIQDA